MKNWSDCTKRERIARWENVLRVLRALTPHERKQHWDMGTWGHRTECGTVACAAGHCGIDPWFTKRGFQTFEDKDDTSFKSGISNDVRTFFGLDGANEIFYDSNPRPVGKVIREVRAYIKQLQAK